MTLYLRYYFFNNSHRMSKPIILIRNEKIKNGLKPSEHFFLINIDPFLTTVIKKLKTVKLLTVSLNKKIKHNSIHQKHIICLTILFSWSGLSWIYIHVLFHFITLLEIETYKLAAVIVIVSLFFAFSFLLKCEEKPDKTFFKEDLGLILL